MIRHTSLALCALTLLALSSQLLPAQEREVALRIGPLELLGQAPSFAEIGIGAFDVLKDIAFTDDDDDRSAAGRLELRLGQKVYALGPAIGLMANTDGGVFGYGGVYFDLDWGNLVLTPLVGLGGYAQGGSKDLGGVFQFLASGTVAYAFPGESRLGVRFSHVSNAGIHNENPGEEDLMLVYSLPFP